MRVGYLGPKETYTWQMAQRLFPGEELVEFSPVRRVVRAVEEGKVDRAIVPFENIVEGPVFDMLDPLAHMIKTRIIGEAWMPIHHALGVLPETTLADVNTIYSHHQGLAQCAQALDALFPRDYALVQTGSTADAAVKIMHEQLRNVAAIASIPALHTAGLAVLVEHLVPHNRTRFGILSTGPYDPFAEEGPLYKTLLSISNLPDSPAALDRLVLDPLRAAGLNKKYIESRRHGKGYRFLIEVQTHAHHPLFTRAYRAMESLAGHTSRVAFEADYKILGTYRDSLWEEGL